MYYDNYYPSLYSEADIEEAFALGYKDASEEIEEEIFLQGYLDAQNDFLISKAASVVDQIISDYMYQNLCKVASEWEDMVRSQVY